MGFFKGGRRSSTSCFSETHKLFVMTVRQNMLRTLLWSVPMTISLSCRSTRHEEGMKVLTLRSEHISRMNAQMTIGDVLLECGPALPADNLILPYPSDRGGQYVFVFLSTNEVEATRTQRAPEPRLVAVIELESDQTLQEGVGRYVYPPGVQGKSFTGFRESAP